MKITLAIALLCSFFAKAQTPVADSLFAVGNYAKAISIYQNSKNPSAKIQYKIGAGYASTGNLKLALQHYKIAVEKDSSLIVAASHYAKLLRQTKQYTKADSVFTTLIRRFPENPEFHYQLGLVREQETDSSGIAQFQKTLRLNPNHQKALYRCAVYNFRQHHFENVEVLCQKALKSYPENEPVRRLLAQNAYAAGNYKTAAKRFETLVARNEAGKSDYKKLGYAYYQLKKFDKAISAFKTVVKLDKTNLEACYTN